MHVAQEHPSLGPQIWIEPRYLPPASEQGLHVISRLAACSGTKPASVRMARAAWQTWSRGRKSAGLAWLPGRRTGSVSGGPVSTVGHVNSFSRLHRCRSGCNRRFDRVGRGRRWRCGVARLGRGGPVGGSCLALGQRSWCSGGGGAGCATEFGLPDRVGQRLLSADAPLAVRSRLAELGAQVLTQG